jgi:hypothetical protein
MFCHTIFVCQLKPFFNEVGCKSVNEKKGSLLCYDRNREGFRNGFDDFTADRMLRSLLPLPWRLKKERNRTEG